MSKLANSENNLADYCSTKGPWHNQSPRTLEQIWAEDGYIFAHRAIDFFFSYMMPLHIFQQIIQIDFR